MPRNSSGFDQAAFDKRLEEYGKKLRQTTRACGSLAVAIETLRPERSATLGEYPVGNHNIQRLADLETQIGEECRQLTQPAGQAEH